MTLGDFSGRAVLLNIWATWCVPCRKEMPSLDRLQAKLGGPDFIVVPLSIDRKGAEVIKPFYRELGLTSLGIYSDQSGKETAALKVPGIPTTLLIDPEGQEVGHVTGAVEWDRPDIVETIRRLLRLPDMTPSEPADEDPNHHPNHS
jgi:thiol-disulfide isomerase/thioredoxin